MNQEQITVRQLVREMLESDRSAEDVCGDHSDLLTDVRSLWQRVRAVQEQAEALFPSSGTRSAAELVPDFTLPQIPGYDVQRILGWGGMGVVYRARHQSLNRIVAIKVPLAGAFASASERQRHMREAQAVAALEHPNIVTVHDVGQFEGRPYFTMEFIDGQSLGAKLANTPQPAREAAALVATLARAVQCAHQAGIIHRDLKPANVLLAPNGIPKITDFGLACHFGSEATLTVAGFQFGTPSYMSPEQASGLPATPSSGVDIYALGAILYEMLTGRPPFRAESAAETLRQVREEEPAPPSRVNPKVPRDLDTICLKCLHKAPARRYPTAASLADDLERFHRGEPITARRVGHVERAGRWVQRNPGATVAAASVVTLAATAAMMLGRSIWANAELSRGVNDDLAAIERFERSGAWSDAREALERAKGRLGERDVVNARARLLQAERDLQLVADLAEIRLSGADLNGNKIKLTEAATRYGKAFDAAGLSVGSLPTARIVEGIKASPIRNELIAALDDWSTCAPTPQQVQKIYDIARSADPDRLWRDKVRDASIIDNARALTALANEAPIDQQSPSILVALGRRIERAKGDPIGFCRRVQLQYPNDFWVNLQLASLLQSRHNPESIGYYLVARAIRPDALIVYLNLGSELTYQGRTAEALEYVRRAVDIAPRSAAVHTSLGVCLLQLGRYDEAVASCRSALAIQPAYAFAAGVMCQALIGDGRFAEANAAARDCLDAMPKDGPDNETLARLVVTSNDLVERERQLGDVLDGKEQVTPQRRRQFASICLLKKRYAEAVRFYEEAFAAEPALADEIGSQVRLEAASAAAKAAELIKDMPERVRLLNNAVTWLRSDLNMRSKMLAGGSETERQALLRAVYPWRWEPRLASIREPEKLREWPPEQQARCRKLWRDVETLIAIAQPAPDSASQIDADSLKQGRDLVAKGDWAGAVDRYAQALAQGPSDDGEFWFEYAAVLLLSGDRAGYSAACARLLERGGVPEMRAYHVARAGTLAEGGIPLAAVLDKLASHSELRENASQFWAQTEQGALAYRADRFQEASSFFEQSLNTDGRPGRAVVNWVWLALAQQRLGKTDDARRWLTKAQNWLDQYREGIPPNADTKLGLHIHNWLEANILRREAEALLSQK